MKAVRIQITPDLFFDKFPFPDGTRVLAASVAANGNLEFELSNESMPEVDDSAEPPMALPSFTQKLVDLNDPMGEWHVVFDGWGIGR